MTFNAWFHDFVTVADRLSVLDLIGDPESHRAAYEDGLSPEQAVEAQIDAIEAFR